MKTRNELIRDAALEWAANNGHAARSGYVMVVNGRPTGCLDLIPPPALVYNGTHLVSLCGDVVQVAVGGSADEYATHWRTVYLNNALAAPSTGVRDDELDCHFQSRDPRSVFNTVFDGRGIGNLEVMIIVVCVAFAIGTVGVMVVNAIWP